MRSLVKLKWLMPISGEPATADDGKQQSVAVIGNGHQFKRVRAGQSVSFECNASGGGAHARSLRVRWFRLVANNLLTMGPQHGTATHRQTTLLGGGQHTLKNDHFALKSSPAPMTTARNSAARLIDENQIRSSLLQLDTIQVLGDSYNRIELINTNGGKYGATNEANWLRAACKHHSANTRHCV
jgi:hypothetical protein